MISKRVEKYYLDLVNKYGNNPNVLIYYMEEGSHHILKVLFGSNVFCLLHDSSSIRVKYIYNYFSRPDEYNTVIGFSIDRLARKMMNEISRRVRVGGFS